MKNKFQRLHPLLIAVSMAALGAAIWAGLIRIGWDLPVLNPSLPTSHGPLMIPAFLGALIATERVVALGKRWMYISPVLSGVGGLILILGYKGIIAPLLLTLGSLGLVLIFGVILRRHFTLYTTIMALGAGALFIGNVLWISGWRIPQIVLWWAGFLILTIAGERLELGRLLNLPPAAKWTFIVSISTFQLGLFGVLIDHNFGTRLSSLGMLFLAIWLLIFDISRKTIHKQGLPRFTASSLLSGYAWLGISGIIGLRFGGLTAGPQYDAFLHSMLLGFVFSMIFGHGPIIFPAILNFPVTYRKTFYIPLILLHSSVLLRVIGDLRGITDARLWGGVINGLAIVIFLINNLISLIRAKTRPIQD